MTAIGIEMPVGDVQRSKKARINANEAHVAVLFARLGPYHLARLNAAAAMMKVTAVEFSDVDLTYAWDLVATRQQIGRVTLFPGVSPASLSGTQIASVLDKTLNNLHPEAVAIPGWFDRCALAALKWCARHAVPAIVMSETNAWDEKRNPWREAVKSRLVRLCSAGLVGGKDHANYLTQLGMARNRVFLGYDGVDNDYFAEKADQIRSQRSEVRDRFRLPERYFLASARFVEKKNLPRLIQAYARYRQLAAKAENRNQKVENRNEFQPSASPISAFGNAWSLVLLGDGPLKSDLCHLISDLSLQDSVLLPGFKQYNDLPVYYALADAFVHASTTEQWGLVVNEAMASGLPVLVSNRCGCAQDFVHEGVNGFTFEPVDVEQLAELMLRISAFNFPLSAFGSQSQRIISSCGPHQFAQGLRDAVEMALKTASPQVGLMDRLFLRLLPFR